MKNYFKDIRNWFHVLIGISVGYAITLLFGFTNRDNFPLSWNDLRTLLAPFVGAIIVWGISFFWEKEQDKIKENVSDMRDVYVSAIAGYIGGFICLFVPSLIIAIILTVMSLVVLINSFKK
jgi:hypothetical protein